MNESGDGDMSYDSLEGLCFSGDKMFRTAVEIIPAAPNSGPPFFYMLGAHHQRPAASNIMQWHY